MKIGREQSPALVVRGADLSALRSFRQESGSAVGPRDWKDVISGLSRNLTGCDIAPAPVGQILDKEAILIAWHPSVQLLLWTMLRRRVIYLCWGMPYTRNVLALYLKRSRLRAILRRATMIFVNDCITMADVKMLSGRAAHVIPYVVDSRFFMFGPASERDDYVLVPGDNGRDEHLVVSLVERGISVKRVYRDARIAEFYSSRKFAGKVDCHYRVSYGRLRELYQRARVVGVPLVAANHAAGQTSVLEAIACGAPVIVSSGRTASIFAGVETVVACDSLVVEDWIKAIGQITARTSIAPTQLKKASEMVGLHNSPEAVERALQDMIKQHFSEYA